MVSIPIFVILISFFLESIHLCTRAFPRVRKNLKMSALVFFFQLSWLTLIHTLQLNFLFSDWLLSKYAECIENVHCTPRTAPRLRPDCARCFWCVIARANVTSTDTFFHWVKLLIFFMISGILKPFYNFSRI